MHSWDGIVTSSVIDQEVQRSICSFGDFVIECVDALNIVDLECKCFNSSFCKV
jgi:hypothetical protein